MYHCIAYDKKTVGNIIYFISRICGLATGERITVGSGVVSLYGTVIATYNNDMEDFPIFTFEDKNTFSNKYVYNIMQEAIKDWKEHHKYK